MMNSKNWSRVLPGVAVAALLSLGISAPPPPPPPPVPPFPPGGPVPPGPGQFPTRIVVKCVDDAIAVTGDSTITFPRDSLGTATGVEQPFPAGLTVAACSLRTEDFGAARIELREWNATLQ